MVQAGKPVSLIMDPTRRHAGHAWAYLPDLAETMVRLCEKADRLGAFEVFHFAGHWLEDGGEMARSMQRACGPRRPMIIPFPWLMVTLLQPFVELFREMEEMRYLWREPTRRWIRPCAKAWRAWAACRRSGPRPPPSWPEG
jgi:nucleoside-diphosphate-sugar epimerase